MRNCNAFTIILFKTIQSGLIHTIGVVCLSIHVLHII